METSIQTAFELIRMAVTGSPEITYDPALDPALPVVYFILDNAPESNIETFVVEKLPRLLSQLSRNTSQSRVEYQGRVRGRVDWQGTYKSRYANSFDPTMYVCSEVHHRYDTLENQLLKYLLTRIQKCLRQIPKVIRDGDCLLLSGPERSSFNTAIRIQRIETAVRNGLRNAQFSGITLPEVVSENHLIRAKTSQNEAYRQAANLIVAYRNLVFSPKWDDFKRISRHTLPVPAYSSGDGQRWIYFGAQLLREFLAIPVYSQPQIGEAVPFAEA